MGKLLSRFERKELKPSGVQEENQESRSFPVGSITEYIPRQYVQKMVKDLKEGEGGFTLPWGVHLYPSGKVVIVGSYPVEPNSFGTMHLRITMHNGVIYVDQRTIEDYRWTPGFPCYAGVKKEDFLPVMFVNAF